MDEPRIQQSPAPECRADGYPGNGFTHPAAFDYQDDLSLAGLWRVLFRQWKVVLTVPIFAVIAAAGYLLIATPQYEAEVVLLPPEPHQIESLNIPGINQVSAEDVYTIFARNLRSHALRRQFFDDNDLLPVLGGKHYRTDDTVFEDQFSSRLKVREGTRDQKDFIYVTLLSAHPEQVAKWVNDFVQLAVTSTVDEIVGGVNRRIGNQRDNLREHLAIARELAKRRREDRIVALSEEAVTMRAARNRKDHIARLDEHIAIAQELGIMDRNDGLAHVLKEQGVGLSVTTGTEPLYLRGVTQLAAEREAIAKRETDDPFLPELREVLAEIDVLKARTDDDPFIGGLRDKEEAVAQLEAGLAQLQSSSSGIAPARIDRKARVPESAASPKKTRVLALSVTAGLLLGVFLAFQVNALDQQRG